ncbi:PE family protein, partial [Mycobacterium interjectum]
MPYVIAAPAVVASVAADLRSIGSALTQAHATAVGPTTGLLAAGADEVSAAVAALFGSHAQAFQDLGARAAAFHAEFVQAMQAAAGSYAASEAANASPLAAAEQDAMGAVNAPAQALFGRPLIGNGTPGGPGQAGGPGGLLY